MSANTGRDLPLRRSAEDEMFVPYKSLKPEHGIEYSRVHIRRMIQDRRFPAPVQLSPNRLAWRLSDLATWKASRPVSLGKAA